jgi:hypothetical protein
MQGRRLRPTRRLLKLSKAKRYMLDRQQRGQELTPGLVQSEIKSETKEGARILTLNRPKALNALTEGMIDSIYPLLQVGQSIIEQAVKLTRFVYRAGKVPSPAI